eukprot:Nk52_evm1s2039 gene=Nk52_evmTU1s2039
MSESNENYYRQQGMQLASQRKPTEGDVVLDIYTDPKLYKSAFFYQVDSVPLPLPLHDVVTITEWNQLLSEVNGVLEKYGEQMKEIEKKAHAIRKTMIPLFFLTLGLYLCCYIVPEGNKIEEKRTSIPTEAKRAVNQHLARSWGEFMLAKGVSIQIVGSPRYDMGSGNVYDLELVVNRRKDSAATPSTSVISPSAPPAYDQCDQKK